MLGGCSSAVDDVTTAISAAPSTTVGVALEPTQDPAIVIETPLDDSQVASRVSVTGTADVIGREVTVRVLDHEGAELAAIDADVDCRDACPGTFGAELFFFVERPEPGWVEVSGETADGRALSRLPVVLFPRVR